MAQPSIPPSKLIKSTFKDATHRHGLPILFDLTTRKFLHGPNLHSSFVHPETPLPPFRLSGNHRWDPSSLYWLVQLRHKGLCWANIPKAMPQLRTTARECQLEYVQMVLEGTVCIDHPGGAVGIDKILRVGGEVEEGSFELIAERLGDGRTAADCSVELYVCLVREIDFELLVDRSRPLRACFVACEPGDREVVKAMFA